MLFSFAGLQQLLFLIFQGIVSSVILFDCWLIDLLKYACMCVCVCDLLKYACMHACACVCVCACTCNVHTYVGGGEGGLGGG